MKKILVLCLFLMLCTTAQGLQSAHAQGAAAAIFGPPKKEDVAATEVPKDALNRETPRGTLSGFLDAISKSDYEKAASYLNLSYMPKTQAVAQGPKLAQGLQTLMDNGSWITALSMVSNDPLGNKEDGLSETLERLGSLKANGETADLLAEKITGAEDIQIWLISTETTKKIPGLVKDLSATWVDRALPDRVLEPKIAGVPVGHWAVMLGLIGLSYTVSWLFVRGIVLVIRKLWKSQNMAGKHVIDAFELPVRLYLSTLLFVIAAVEIGISVVARQYFSSLTIVVAWVSIALLMWKLIDVISEVFEKKLIARGKYGALSGVQFFRRMAKFLFLAIALFSTLSAVGIDITGVLAALGIGGLALAFGAQKTIENFIGSIMVIFDQPVRIGDFCKVGEIQGTIEDIGMRSTRIRTLNRTLITIPNGDFSAQRIENYALRDQFRIHSLLNIRLDVTADQLRYLIVHIRSLLYSHPRIDAKTANVKFIAFTEYSAQLEVIGYVMTRINDDFLEVREDIYLRIMDIIQESGTNLTTPSTPYAPFFAKHHQQGHDPRDVTEQKVKEMKENGDLPLPKFEPSRIDALKNSLDYPSKGSSTFKGKRD